MERWLNILYNVVLLSLLIISGMIYVPFISLQLILIVIIALSGSIFLLPVYILIGLLLPILTQGGGMEYLHEPYFLLLVIFALLVVLMRPLLKVKSTKPWVWYPFLSVIYLSGVYLIFSLLSLVSIIIFKNSLPLELNIDKILIMNFFTLIIASVTLIFINTVKESLNALLGKGK